MSRTDSVVCPSSIVHMRSNSIAIQWRIPERRPPKLENGTLWPRRRGQILIVIPALFVPALRAPPQWPFKSVYHQGSKQQSNQWKAVSSRRYCIGKLLVSSSTRASWLGTWPAHTGSGMSFCTHHFPWIGWGDTHSWGQVLWKSVLCRTCRASLTAVGQAIGSSQWLYWELGSPHPAKVCHPCWLQTRLMLLQAMMNAEWIHWLGLFRYRPWWFSTKHPNDCRFWHMVEWCRVADWLHHQFVSVVWVFLPYHHWTHPHSHCIL